MIPATYYLCSLYVQAWAAAEAVVLSVTIDPGPVLLMEELHKACKSQFPMTRTVSYAVY